MLHLGGHMMSKWLTSVRRSYVASTLGRRRYDVICLLGKRSYQAGAWRRNDVILTFMQHNDIASASLRRHFNVMYLLGKQWNLRRCELFIFRKGNYFVSFFLFSLNNLTLSKWGLLLKEKRAFRGWFFSGLFPITGANSYSQICPIPAGTWRRNDVLLTLMPRRQTMTSECRRCDVTSHRRQYVVMSPLGMKRKQSW